MQVTVEATGELERRLTVQVPAARIEQEVDNRLRSLARTARVDGFRPGKVPFKVVQTKYEARVRQEVVDEVINSTYRDALTQQQLHPAGEPKFEHGTALPGQDFRYTATIEVFPQLQLAPVAGIAIEKPVAEVTEADIDAMIETLRKQRVTWSKVNRPAQQGDQVTIDYSVTVDGAATPAYKEKQAPIVLGSHQMLEGFDERLTGMSAGTEAVIDLRYPESHSNAALAGKPVSFNVRVAAVAEAHFPALDDEFAHSFGMQEGGVAALRNEVAANMRRELALVVKSKVKDQVLNALQAANPVNVPETLVEQEADRLATQSDSPELAGQPGSGSRRLPSALFKEQARRRVALGLIVGEVVRTNQIRVDAARVRATIETIASSYEQPEEVIKWYYGNSELMSGIEGLTLEDQVVDWVLERANVREVPTTFAALMHPGQNS